VLSLSRATRVCVCCAWKRMGRLPIERHWSDGQTRDAGLDSTHRQFGGRRRKKAMVHHGRHERPRGERGLTHQQRTPATPPTTRAAIKPPAKQVQQGSMLGKGRPHAFTSRLRCGWAQSIRLSKQSNELGALRRWRGLPGPITDRDVVRCLALAQCAPTRSHTLGASWSPPGGKLAPAWAVCDVMKTPPWRELARGYILHLPFGGSRPRAGGAVPSVCRVHQPEYV